MCFFPFASFDARARATSSFNVLRFYLLVWFVYAETRVAVTADAASAVSTS